MLSMPTACWLCRMPLALPAQGICSLCLRQLPIAPPCCPRCGLPALHIRQECGRCQLKPPPWQRMMFVTGWQPPLRDWVKQLKFSGATALSVMLARLFLLSWLAARRQFLLDKPDLLLCVPLHRKRAWLRGYNQMDDVTRHLSRWIGCSYAAAGLKRQRRTRIQHSLRASARKRNLRGAFRVEIAVKGRHIALVDDVITTGSTVGEISRILLAAGAASVQVWSLCRTL
ncbi:DNA utilization protein GntX [Pantoea sp. BAV 3049]|uniref:DNA utilization protein GntX n=1 Tax=Pantoea sp. BAV 3049 TaxID=2654188 RepID=UPI00131AA6E0|nr:DNA utilization protein GntX [Pantoea sp. BAV 3049]